MSSGVRTPSARVAATPPLLAALSPGDRLLNWYNIQLVLINTYTAYAQNRRQFVALTD